MTTAGTTHKVSFEPVPIVTLLVHIKILDHRGIHLFQVGNVTIHLISDGTMKIDGGIMFGQVPKTLWEPLVKPDGKNRIRIGINSLFIQSNGTNILVDPGIGSKLPDQTKERFGIKGNMLVKTLRDTGVMPADIHHVVFTHLHFDHAGGATKYNRKGEPVPTFPNARHWVQQAAWNDATSPNERTRASYFKDDFLPLHKYGLIERIEGNGSIIPGVTLELTGGHTSGHQIIIINQAGVRVGFLGDLVPTPYHLGLPYITALDQYPEETLEQKRTLLTRASQEGWLLTFVHGHENKAGYIEGIARGISLRPFEI